MSETITETYLKLQSELHQNPNYGVASLSFAPIIAKIIKNLRIESITDYGAGKKRLLEGLHNEGIISPRYFPYDPVFPDYGPPMPADLVCCIDVLEHIEPDLLGNVLQELSLITNGIGFFSIHMGPAVKVLSDGRNAHLIQQPSSWWLPRLCKYFDILQLNSHKIMGKGIWLIVKRI